jgi:stearoyl-CoA desaturase (delta-9 desaturase)
MIEAPPSSSAVGIVEKDRPNWVESIPFIFVHLWAVWAVFHTGFHWRLAMAALISYYVRMAGVTIAYHRYFSHRAFKTSRLFQFVLAFWAEASLQKGVLWWASNHRHHHKYSDQPEDVHSPRQRGFWYSQIGWILSDKYTVTDFDRIKDFAKYPELRWLNKYHLVPPLLMGAVVWAIWGYDVFLWAGIIGTAVLWHGTFFVNSLTHLFGRRRYLTTDDSRNSFLVALITCGEGWHNNHHFYQSTANAGWHWWQIDLSYYVIKVLQTVGLIWEVRLPPKHVVDTPGDEPLVNKLKNQLPGVKLPEVEGVEPIGATE